MERSRRVFEYAEAADRQLALEHETRRIIFMSGAAARSFGLLRHAVRVADRAKKQKASKRATLNALRSLISTFRPVNRGERQLFVMALAASVSLVGVHLKVGIRDGISLME